MKVRCQGGTRCKSFAIIGCVSRRVAQFESARPQMNCMRWVFTVLVGAGGMIAVAEKPLAAFEATARPVAAAPVEPLAANAGTLAMHLQLWLRADSLGHADGAAVPVWPDQSGHGRDLSATKGIRPDGTGLPPVFVSSG